MTTGEVLREKIARAIEDNLKSQGIRVVVDIAAQPDVRHICDGMLSLGALADAILALIEPVMEENERKHSALIIAVEALGRVNVRCWDRPSSPLKPIGDIAREALSSIMQTMGDEAYDEIARAALSPKSEKRDD
jgi:hypothetical protein